MAGRAPSAEEIDALWDFEDPAGSERRFQDLLAEFIGRPAEAAEIQTQIARTLSLRGKFEEAHRVLDGVEPLLPAAPSQARARYLLERGRALNSAGNPAGAVPLFREALEVARQAGEEFYALDAAHMLGIAEPDQRGLEWNLRAVEMASASRDPRGRGWLGSLYNNIGWYHHDQGRYVEALRHFEAALQEHRRQGNPRKIQIARWCQARGLRSLGRVEEALRIQQELLAEAQRTGREDRHVCEELVECLTALGRAGEAEPYRQRLARLLESNSNV